MGSRNSGAKPLKQKEETRMNALIIEPEKTPRIADIENDLKTLQAIVGGYIEIVYTVALVCNV